MTNPSRAIERQMLDQYSRIHPEIDKPKPVTGRLCASRASVVSLVRTYPFFPVDGRTLTRQEADHASSGSPAAR